ncbi:MAG: DDE-type integrase/transposase/recombinase [Deltaproteobacteria bacterium]|nr:DDE-type integrase/transposase/recombinase [Deltaproteobacteria bacterium]
MKLPHPTTKQIIDVTGVSRSRAYELRDTLHAVLPTLQRAAGRPKAAPPSRSAERTDALSHAALRFVMTHPGCVYGGPSRNHYSIAYRHFVLELRQQHPAVDLERFAHAIELPLGTLKDWLSPGPLDKREQTQLANADNDRPVQTAGASFASPTSVHIETVLAAWEPWNGGFVTFCEHVQRDWRVPFGKTLIANILEAEGVRIPKRRKGRRSADEAALRGSFVTFFSGAQWVGDGTAIDVVIDGEVFTFNLELVVDAFSGGFVGISVRDEEDSDAVIEAFDDGVHTAGASPLALLLDNRASNHTEDVDAALGDTLRMRSTPGRAQNKAHVEGAFGLFKQTAPPLEINTATTRETARQMAELQAQTWFRTVNHLPRRDRNGRTRVDLYQEHHSKKQVAQARAALEERCRKQMLAQRTLEARQDPVVRQLLNETFERLSLIDYERNIRNAIATYPFNAIVNGIAIYEGKCKAGTLPDGVDGNYLLGIVRNLAQLNEGHEIAEALLRTRLHARDFMLAELALRRGEALSAITDPVDVAKRFVEFAMDTKWQIDRLFWIQAISDVIASEPQQKRTVLFISVARRIHASFHVSHRERLYMTRIIATKIFPLG